MDATLRVEKSLRGKRPSSELSVEEEKENKKSYEGSSKKLKLNIQSRIALES